jgi:hyperosmotically inducible protein
MMRYILVTGLLFAALVLSTVAHAETAGQFIDDTTVTTKVKAALMQNQNLKATQVGVKTEQGTVILSGTVDNADQEAEAVRTANQVAGVKIVKDVLQIREP